MEQVYNSLDSRIFLVENSKGMCGGDSHVMKGENDGGSVGKVDGASRWDELSQVSCLGDVYRSKYLLASLFSEHVCCRHTI